MRKNKLVRTLLIFLSLALITAALASCSSSSTSAPAASGDAAPAEAAAPAADGGTDSAEVDRDHTLIWTVPNVPPGFDNNYNNTPQAVEAIHNMYDSATYFPPIKDEESGFLIPDFANLQPWLAESLDISEDGLTYTVKLREGVISHWGNELTAEDFMYERERSTSQTGMNNFVNSALRITDLGQIKVLDKYTFSVTLENPNPIFGSFLTHRCANFIDSVAMKEHDTADDPQASKFYALQGAGHGPYKLDSYTPGDNATFLAHDQYWDRENVPMYFKKIIMKEVPQSSNRLALVMSGDADVDTYPTPQEILEAQGKPGVKVMSWKSNLLVRLDFNHEVEPFNNPNVIKAINYCIPSEEILDAVYLGTATQAKSNIPTMYDGYTDAYWKYTLDYDEAKRLLAEAGYADGFSTVIEVMTEYPQEEQIAIILRDSLKNIGIDVVIEKVQGADFWSKGNQRDFKGMFIWNDFCGVPDASFAYKLWIYSQSEINFGGYKNDEVDRLYMEMNETLDQELRLKNIDRIQEITLWEDPAFTPLVEPGFHLIMRDDVDGMFWSTSNEVFWAHAYRNE